MGDDGGFDRLAGLIAAGLQAGDRPLVAVSGGSDSTALLVLAAEAARRRSLPLQAVTVDHGLRPEAGAEAQAVAALCARLGVPHRTLVWQHGDIAGNLMAAARAARYRLIGELAAAGGAGPVLVAHTADDLAETFLMRLSRAAGIDGLVPMRARWQGQGASWWRPLLGTRRQALRDMLTARGIGWSDDPSNVDPGYARVRMRQALAALEPLGLTVEAICASSANLAEARDSAVLGAVRHVNEFVTYAHGQFDWQRDPFAALPDETQRRILVAMLGFLSGADYPPRAQPVAALRQAILAAGGQPRAMTLGGCHLRVAATGRLRLGREAAALQGVAALPGTPWDGRFVLTPDHGHAPEGIRIRALGPAGLAAFADWRPLKLSQRTAAVTPGVWQDDRLIAAPLAGWPQGWQAATAEGRDSLGRWLLSH